MLYADFHWFIYVVYLNTRFSVNAPWNCTWVELVCDPKQIRKCFTGKKDLQNEDHCRLRTHRNCLCRCVYILRNNYDSDWSSVTMANNSNWRQVRLFGAVWIPIATETLNSFTLLASVGNTSHRNCVQMMSRHYTQSNRINYSLYAASISKSIPCVNNTRLKISFHLVHECVLLLLQDRE